MRHAQKPENIQNEEEMYSIETDSEMTHMIELVNKDIETSTVMRHIMMFWSMNDGLCNCHIPYSLGKQ